MGTKQSRNGLSVSLPQTAAYNHIGENIIFQKARLLATENPAFTNLATINGIKKRSRSDAGTYSSLAF
jgi:hypothetical protein